MKEFQIIERYFAKLGPKRQDVLLSVGDDCAVLDANSQRSITITTDTLVEGVHFYKDMPADALAYKAMAANISDLAAMGAEPAWATLAITLPDIDESWLEKFAASLSEVCDYYGISLIGGDTCKGDKLHINITAMGWLPKGKALTRSGAKAGDWIYVTGNLGDSAVGLKVLNNQLQLPFEVAQYVIKRHYYPKPRVRTGMALRHIANACLDLSDGLISDIPHILKSSDVAADIQLEKLPISHQLKSVLSQEDAIELALTGGEDYELLFTISAEQRGVLETALNDLGLSATCIGQIRSGSGVNFTLNGTTYQSNTQGFAHFE